jgi:hypothetical protein
LLVAGLFDDVLAGRLGALAGVAAGATLLLLYSFRLAGISPVASAKPAIPVTDGVPFVVLTAYFPIAVYRDADYVNRTSGQWGPDPQRYALGAALGLVVLLAVGAGTLLAGASPAIPVIAGFVVSVPFAVYYLYRRHETVGTP